MIKILKGNSGATGRGSYNDRFPRELVIVSSKNEFTLTQRVLDVLGNPGFVEVYDDGECFAIRGTNDPTNGYKVQSRSKKAVNGTKYIACGLPIRVLNIPHGYYFIGRAKDAYIVFSKTPNGKS